MIMQTSECKSVNHQHTTRPVRNIPATNRLLTYLLVAVACIVLTFSKKKNQGSTRARNDNGNMANLVVSNALEFPSLGLA